MISLAITPLSCYFVFNLSVIVFSRIHFSHIKITIIIIIIIVTNPGKGAQGKLGSNHCIPIPY